MVIGVISDTHGLLRPEALELLQGSDLILHAGDMGSPDIIPALAKIAPVTAVRGNVDGGAWAREYEEEEFLEVAGRSFYMIHDIEDLDLDPAEAGFDAVIYGHSHQPKMETLDGVLYFNPGSAGPRRFKLPITVARITLQDGALLPEIFALDL